MTETMKAIRHVGYHTFPELKDVPKPSPGPGEVLLKVAGSGACHSDVAIFNEFDEGLVPALDPEYTLGHEISGWVEEVGDGVAGLDKGDAYLVYGPTGCGRCDMCARGAETYCRYPEEAGANGLGLGRDGGMAEYVVVPAGNLIPLGDADPIAASALADAGLTPYHAIKKALPALNGGGKTALVIGLGGLGLIAVQILKALTGATIIATDAKEEALSSAADLGATTVPVGDKQVEQIRELTGGRGVDAVFDFVGIGATVTTALRSAGVGADIAIVGLGDGSAADWSFRASPYEARLYSTYWGSRDELFELVEMLRRGQIEPLYTTYPLEKGLEAYQLLLDGKVSGRAVIVPHGE
ncbi:alcohol dehydrogenase catalytic domain-containing protein [Corynebacterium timonense]|uniref:Alcohol dehydrogenase, propanol-preferring n=1 Tax=Corynebacterium timonense TaxID=441500 RepID=A0A1H1LL27_9CORY|nr:alcohol dehydrogenase catalytic domain-containing protein [Corynebacterium timonense]SDR74735.1 alcohol dehydrogenase, propanol-preferring [Corynebacterium timonense]